MSANMRLFFVNHTYSITMMCIKKFVVNLDIKAIVRAVIFLSTTMKSSTFNFTVKFRLKKKLVSFITHTIGTSFTLSN